MSSLLFIIELCVVIHHLTRHPLVHALSPVPPRNEAVVRGDQARITCLVSDGDDASRVTWHAHLTTPTGGTRALRSDARYNVTVDGGASTLDIINVTSEDAGRYSCVDRQASDVGFFELVVLDSLPVCANDNPSNETVTGDRLRFTCAVNYTGRWAPIVRWQVAVLGVYTMPLLALVNDTVAGAVRYSLAFVVRPEHDGKRLTAVVGFSLPLANVSRDRPTFVYRYESEPLSVLFGPRYLRVSPARRIYYHGESVWLKADANPPARCRWVDRRTNFSVDSDRLEIRSGMLGRQRYFAVAMNTIRGVLQTRALSVYFSVRSYRRTSTVAVIGMALGLSAIGLTCLMIAYYTIIDGDWAREVQRRHMGAVQQRQRAALLQALAGPPQPPHARRWLLRRRQHVRQRAADVTPNRASRDVTGASAPRNDDVMQGGWLELRAPANRLPEIDTQGVVTLEGTAGGGGERAARESYFPGQAGPA